MKSPVKVKLTEKVACQVYKKSSFPKEAIKLCHMIYFLQNTQKKNRDYCQFPKTCVKIKNKM